MHWPDELTIRVRPIEVQRPIDRLVTFVTIFASTKNNYTLGPLLTDDTGAIALRRDFVEREIHETRREFPMDYVDELEDCEPRLVVEIESRASLEERLRRIKDFYPQEAAVLENLLEGGANFWDDARRMEIDMSSANRLITLELD